MHVCRDIYSFHCVCVCVCEICILCTLGKPAVNVKATPLAPLLDGLYM